MRKKRVIIEWIRNKQNKKWSKKKIEYTGWRNKRCLEKVDVNLTTLELRCILCEKPYDFKKEREIRLSAKEKINKIEGLKEEV